MNGVILKKPKFIWREIRCISSGSPWKAYRGLWHCGPMEAASYISSWHKNKHYFLCCTVLVIMNEPRLKGSFSLATCFQRATETEQYVAGLECLQGGYEKPLYETVRHQTHVGDVRSIGCLPRRGPEAMQTADGRNGVVRPPKCVGSQWIFIINLWCPTQSCRIWCFCWGEVSVLICSNHSLLCLLSCLL